MTANRSATPEESPHTADRELVASLVTLHDVLSDDGVGDSCEQRAAEAIQEALSAVASAGEQAQLLGLSDIAMRLGEHVGTAAPDGAAALHQLLVRFVIAAADYVTDPVSRDAQEALLACVSSGCGALLPADELDILRLMLGMTPDDVPGLPAVASPDDACTVVIEGAEPPKALDAAVLRAFAQEARPVLEELSRVAAELPASLDGNHPESLHSIAADLESLIRGAEFSGLAGLATVLTSVHRAVTEGHFGAREQLQDLAPAVIAYLEAPTELARAEPLVSRIPAANQTALMQALSAVEVVEIAPAKPARAVTACAGDVSLDLPKDINPELLDGLLIELPVQTAAFAQAVQRIVEGQATRDDLIVAKRAAHTLKGAANTVGVRGIASLTHALEDILLALSEHAVLPNLGLAQTLSYASDCLEAMSETLSGAGSPPEDAIHVLQDVLNWANRIDQKGIEVARGEPAAEPASPIDNPAAQPAAEREPAAMLRVPATLIDELLRLVGETMTSTVQIQTRIAQATAQARAISRQNALLQQLVGELETMVDLRGLSAPGKIAATTAIQTADFDALEFEQYNELHTLSRRLMEVATDAREMGLAAEEHLATLAELQEDQSRLQVANQKAVMSTRMVPVSAVFSRLQRGVRQACRILDKQAELVLHGEGTVMDGNVLQELIDALMHLLRNAVDHGIEPPAERLAAGKPAVGRIDLEFRREGDYIAVRCADDGQGLDLDAIRSHAERSGLILPDAHLSADETARLILLPGVSTRDKATQVSGRGIGMDAVNSKVLELKGSLQLASQRHIGLTVELKLPVTLLSTHALLVRVRNKVIAISTRGIEDIQYVAADALDEIPAALRALTSEAHEVLELEQILDLPGDRRTKGRRGWPVLMVRLVSGGLRGVIVQELLESRNVVVKSVGPYVPKIQGLIGATILGDGSVAAVIDLPDRLYSPGYVHALAAPRTDTKTEEAPATGRPRVLVVDDSISARRSLMQVVRDAGYDVRSASDGLEAITILEQRVPDIIITDMEMPRMNGFELAQHLRASDATRHVPVIMVTSRSTAKHRRQAELAGVNVYLTKPFDDRNLLDHLNSLTAPTT